MNTDNEELMEQSSDKHILIAVDGSEQAKKAVLYVASILGGVRGFRVTLFTVINEPHDDYFETGQERKEWIEKNTEQAQRLLDNYRQILLHSGFKAKEVSVRVNQKKYPTIAECILDSQRRLDCCTVVVGHRRKTRKEEFMFGSTSKIIVRMAKNCAVWVI